MILKFSTAALVAVCLLGSPALAQDGARKKLDDDKVICKGIESTGSLVKKKKKCMTRRDWQALADATRDQALGSQMTGSASGQ